MATSLYRGIADELRASIYRGDLKPGAQLPTESELQSEYGVSRNTIRLALGLLINEGLIQTIPRQGTFVRDRRPLRLMLHDAFAEHPPITEHDAFTIELLQEGRIPRQDIEVHIIRPAEDIATRLELPDDGLAAVRRRLKYVDHSPYLINDSYFPLHLVEGSRIMNPTEIVEGANQVLTGLGHMQVRVEDEIISRMPTVTESNRLELQPGTPVTVHIRTGYDEDNNPVRVAVTTVSGDKGILIYKLDRS